MAFARRTDTVGNAVASFPTALLWGPLGAVVSGILFAWAFPRADIGLLAWIALVPLFFTFPHRTLRSAIGCGYLFGFVQAIGVVYWMGVFAASKIDPQMGLVASLLTGVIHAPWTALFAATVHLVWNRSTAVRLTAIPAAWVLCEWFAQLGTFGMGWGDFGYSQWRNIPVLQLSSLTGVFGISFAIVLVNVAIASRNRREWGVAAIALAVVVAWGCGAMRIPAGTPTLRVAAIQENINQDVYWSDKRPADAAYFYGTLSTFDRMIADAQRRGAKLAVLPETAIPGFIQFDGELRGRVENWATANNMVLVAGGRYLEPVHGKNQNVVLLIEPHIGNTGIYAKARLVPFGEYLPYRQLFGFFKALQVSVVDEAPGSQEQMPLTTNLSVGNGLPIVVGPMVCYESSYSNYGRNQAARGADVLGVVTDDEWYGHTSAAMQHMAMSAMRAAESQRSLVRAAVSGVSVIFDSRGRQLTNLDWFKQGIIVADVPIETQKTLYVRFGDWIVAVCAVIWLTIGAMALLRIGGSAKGDNT